MNLIELLKTSLNEEGITEEKLIAKLKEHDAFKEKQQNISGLLNKRDELLAKNKKLKEQINILKKQRDAIQTPKQPCSFKIFFKKLILPLRWRNG